MKLVRALTETSFLPQAAYDRRKLGLRLFLDWQGGHCAGWVDSERVC
jgi:hypothetical protein